MTRQEMEKLLGDAADKETVDALLNAMHQEIRAHKDAAAAAQAELQRKERELAEAAGGAESARELQARLDALQARYDADVQDARQRLADAEFGALLDGAIRERGGRNPRAIKSLMDMDALRESDDQPGAVCAALEQLLTDEGYLFERATPIPTGGRRDIGGNAGVPPDGDGDARMRAVMGLPVERCG